MADVRCSQLIRVPTLRAGQRALTTLVGALTPEAARTTAVLLPTSAASAQLRRTIERHRFGAEPLPPPAQPTAGPEGVRRAICWPELVTRGGFYGRLHARLPAAPPLLDEYERETLMRASARDAVAAGAVPPFTLRPGLVAEMLRFYDAVLRLRRTVDDVDRVLCGTLVHEAESDRGAARLLAQTRFLVESFRAFEVRRRAVHGLDEHGLRDLAVSTAAPRPLRHVVVTVGDIASDAAGLWPADFDLLARLPGLERIDVVVTEAVLACGLYERLEERLPGITEVRFESFEPPPVLVVPDAQEPSLHHVARDREDELLAFARRVKWDLLHDAPEDAGVSRAVPDDHAVVVQRPLPYVYLARHAFDAAGLPWTASDALPLAAEPYAAALDLACECVLADYSRAPLIGLLRSPLFAFLDGAGAGAGAPARDAAVAALDDTFERAGFAGGEDQLRNLLATRVAEGDAAETESAVSVLGRAARAALGVLDALAPLATSARVSDHTRTLLDFLDRYEARPPALPADVHERHLRARAAIRAAVTRLGEASRALDDPVVTFRETLASLRRWIEARTFEPRVGESGLHVLDALAARYADVDVVRILGLVDGEWPEPGQRGVFYPASLLADLGWPRDADRTTAARAAFSNLLALPRLQISVSAFTLEEDAIVQPAVLLEELETCGLQVVRLAAPPLLRVTQEEGLAFAPAVVRAGGEASAWVHQRLARPDARDLRFHGFVGALHRSHHAVTQIDTYLQCPFRFFAERVLRLEDEREDEPGLTPRERGELTHRVFQQFFQQWSAAGHAAITEDNVDAARRLFAAVTEEALAGLPAADATVERARLLGSAAAPAMGDRVLRHELDREAEIVERRLEEALDGTYSFADADGVTHAIALRGKADRIDFLHGGRLDVIDYKTGRAPDARSIQLPVYAHVAELRFDGHRGVTWKAGAADYVAFRGRAVTRALGRTDVEREARLAEAQRQFVGAVAAVGRGEFPPRPADVRLCSWCPHGQVCRKDYVGEGDA
jgi:RecB family exonuclease